MTRQSKLQVMKRLVGEFHQSGLSPKEFCAERGLKTHLLSYWRQRLQDQAQPAKQHSGFTMLERIRPSNPIVSPIPTTGKV
jgi:transposase-like protein